VNRITEIAVERGIGSLWGTVLRENTTMLEMCANLGFSFSDDPFDPTILHATRKIGPAA